MPEIAQRRNMIFENNKDDAVKVNYSKFREILYEIKGLNKDE